MITFNQSAAAGMTRRLDDDGAKNARVPTRKTRSQRQSPARRSIKSIEGTQNQKKRNPSHYSKAPKKGTRYQKKTETSGRVSENETQNRKIVQPARRLFIDDEDITPKV